MMKSITYLADAPPGSNSSLLLVMYLFDIFLFFFVWIDIHTLVCYGAFGGRFDQEIAGVVISEDFQRS